MDMLGVLRTLVRRWKWTLYPYPQMGEGVPTLSPNLGGYPLYMKVDTVSLNGGGGTHYIPKFGGGSHSIPQFGGGYPLYLQIFGEYPLYPQIWGTGEGGGGNHSIPKVGGVSTLSPNIYTYGWLFGYKLRFERKKTSNYQF